jgi:hypothetical protein
MYLLKIVSVPEPKERNQECYFKNPATQFMKSKSGLKTTSMRVVFRALQQTFIAASIQETLKP